MSTPRLSNRPLLPLVAAALMIACGNKGNDKGARTRPPPLVSVEKVRARDVPVEIHAPVELRPILQADVSSKSLGYLDAVFVDRGDKVKKGQLLAVVRPSDLPDQLNAARGTLAQTEAAVALAKANYDRAKTLAPQGLLSQADLQASNAALASAEANQQAVRAQIGGLAVKLGETKLYAPMDGLVWQRKLDPGTLVGPLGGGAVVTIVAVDSLRVFVSVNERDAGLLSIDQEAHVEVDALPGKTYTGKVVRLAPAFDPTTRTLDAEVQLPNPGELRPGMYGRASIVLGIHHDATVVSVSAVQISNSARYVFVLVGDKVSRRAVTMGVDGGDFLELTEGVKPGEEVVIAGADGLSDGATVRVSRDVDPFTGANTAPTLAKAADAGVDSPTPRP